MDGPIDTDNTINKTVFQTFFSMNSIPKKSGKFIRNMSRLTVTNE
jgi:mannosyltransferase OCH1-like enzyme